MSSGSVQRPPELKAAPGRTTISSASAQSRNRQIQSSLEMLLDTVDNFCVANDNFFYLNIYKMRQTSVDGRYWPPEVVESGLKPV